MTEFAQDPPRPVVNETRGALVALVIIPVGVVAWGILWNFGFIASIVGFVVAYGAMFLYRWGSGGRITRLGAALITVITLVTLLLSFFGGIVLDALKGFSEGSGLSAFELFFDSRFWDGFFLILNEPGVLGSYAPDFGLALLFGALGCFQVIRNAFKEASAPAAPADVGVGEAQASTDPDAWPSTNPAAPQPTSSDAWPSVNPATAQPMNPDTFPPTNPDALPPTKPDAPRL